MLCALRNRPLVPAFQFRFTRICPVAPEPLVSETVGAALVRVTFCSEPPLPPVVITG